MQNFEESCQTKTRASSFVITFFQQATLYTSPADLLQKRVVRLHDRANFLGANYTHDKSLLSAALCC